MFALKSELNTQDTIALDFELQAFQVSCSLSCGFRKYSDHLLFVHIV